MNERTSDIDGQRYAIGFEMRLPANWSGQYLYQANGGLDGVVATAHGAVAGSDSGLQMGMAVISSDAGHEANQNPTFGLDPQARLDYGYLAVGTLTPMAKAMIQSAYGSPPKYSYMAGSSNGGRHAMVAADRYSQDYDGFLAVAPGFNFPKAATAHLWEAQQWSSIANGGDLDRVLTTDQRQLIADAILKQCDGLDGVVDGMVFASAPCQALFDIEQHTPTCTTDNTQDCLSSNQQRIIKTIYGGATTKDGLPIYAAFPYDPGLTDSDWSSWKFSAPTTKDAAGVGYVFSTPPYAPNQEALHDFALTVDIDEVNDSLESSSQIYTQSAVDFMTPPDLTYQNLQADAGKMLVLHGAADGAFSMEDTNAWYQDLQAAHHGTAAEFVRYYEIPGMTHTQGGPATDQHNSLDALISWVEHDQQPDAIYAWVNPTNESLPNDWSQQRSRSLCAYPKIAYYTGGDRESESSFQCRDLDMIRPQSTATDR